MVKYHSNHIGAYAEDEVQDIAKHRTPHPIALYCGKSRCKGAHLAREDQIKDVDNDNYCEKEGALSGLCGIFYLIG